MGLVLRRGCGCCALPGAARLLTTAEAGGSNGYRVRSWETELATFAAETGLEIQAGRDERYYPRGVKVTSKQLAAVPLTPHLTGSARPLRDERRVRLPSGHRSRGCPSWAATATLGRNTRETTPRRTIPAREQHDLQDAPRRSGEAQPASPCASTRSTSPCHRRAVVALRSGRDQGGHMTDDELLAAFPGVRIDFDNAAHHRGLLEHRLLVQRCDDCATWHHPPRSVCPRCWSSAVTPTEVSGDGEVAFLTILRQGPPAPGVDYSEGHALVAIELDEQPGLRIASTVVGLPAAEVRIGQRVRLLWRDVAGRPPRPEFEPAAQVAS